MYNYKIKAKYVISFVFGNISGVFKIKKNIITKNSTKYGIATQLWNTKLAQYFSIGKKKRK